MIFDMNISESKKNLWLHFRTVVETNVKEIQIDWDSKVYVTITRDIIGIEQYITGPSKLISSFYIFL